MTVAKPLHFFWILTVFAQITGDDLSCPKGSRIHLTNLHCYWLGQTQESWHAARERCQRTMGGDLAIINSADIQSFVQHAFPLASSVWIGLNDESWVDGSPPDLYHNWENPIKKQKGCVQITMGSGGQWKSTGCGKKDLFICEKHAAAPLPATDTFLTGLPVMTGVYTVSNVSVLPVPPDVGQHNIEMMLFPGLWFSHSGQVVSVEFVIQPIKQQTQARVQVLRPYCLPSQHLVPPGCRSLFNPFTCCSSVPLCNTTGGCASGQQWCHLQESCLPLPCPCTSYSLLGLNFDRPPRHMATPPLYHLEADLPLSLPPNPEPEHINVLLLAREIKVYPDDILAVQHTAGTGSFLHCPGSDNSPWRQSYLSLSLTAWWEGASAVPSRTVWVDEVVCDLRVLYTDSLWNYAITPSLSTGQRDPDSYMYSITVANSMSSSTASCTVEIRPPVTGLQIVHPLPTGGQIHLQSSQPTLIIVKILSGGNATSFWSAPMLSSRVPFHSACPLDLPVSVPGCQQDTPDTWFSYSYASLPVPLSQILNISVFNEVSSQSLSVGLQAHHMVQGLSMQPQGDQRMLVDVSQVFKATVRSGSSVTYSWVIDDLIRFAYSGQIYSVVFRKPAVYKLKVTAENPVSSESLEVKLTAGLMHPLEDPMFLSVGEVLAVNTSQVFVFRVKVDISISVTFRWDFGDDSLCLNHSFTPPYASSPTQSDHVCEQIYLEDSVNHIYTQPGDYEVRVQVFNSYDRTEKAVSVKVRSLLSALSLSLTPAFPVVNNHFQLEALPRPSSYGTFYTWNFGDGSQEINGFHSKTDYTYRTEGLYNITVCADNTLNVLCSWIVVEVVESISGFHLTHNGPSELGSPTVFRGTVSSGTKLTWTFDMGDGSVFSNLPDGSISHVYKQAGNYSAKAIVKNPISHASQSIHVVVYRLIVTGILPSGCLVAGYEVSFQALATGKESTLNYYWDFGDGSPLSIIQGNATAPHHYSTTGTFPVNVTVFSLKDSFSYQTEICVEALITSLMLNCSNTEVAVDQEVCFSASVVPKPDKHHHYQFQWYIGLYNKLPVRGSSNYCYMFKAEGSHQVKVVVSNNVNNRTDTIWVTVQKPLGKLIVKHDGGIDGELALNKAYSFMVETYSGTSVLFLWDFGDGSPNKEGQNCSHVFTSPGRFKVSVIASNSVSKEKMTIEVEVLTPISDLVVRTHQSVVEVGQETVITATTNIMMNVSFYWSVDPFVQPELGKSSFEHTFSKAGVYTILVIAQNPISKQKATVIIEVFERVQGLSIRSQDLISGRYIPTKVNVSFMGSIEQGSNVTFEWFISQNGINVSGTEGEQFTLFADLPGDILFTLRARNHLGMLNDSILVRAVEHISGVRVITARNSVLLGKPIEILVSVATGTDLEYIWHMGSKCTPQLSNMSFAFYECRSKGPVVITVSVINVLGSIEGSKDLRVQEEVGEVSFQIRGNTNPFFVPSNTQLAIEGLARQGSDLNWHWQVCGKTAYNIFYKQSIIYSFQETGDYQVSLNVSNDVSWKERALKLIVQDTIQGLTLNVSQSVVCTGDPLVFKLSVLKGSDVQFSLNFTYLNLSVTLEKDTYTTTDLPAGNHSVTAGADNFVSSSTAILMVEVVEKLHGLRLVNCCFHILEAHKEVSFQAEHLSGSQANYQWTFQFPGYPTVQAAGPQVFYTPPDNGSLTISVIASNAFCSLYLTEHTTVQSPVLEAKLDSNLTEVFIDQPVAFWVVLNGGSNLLYQWSFGNVGAIIINKNSTAVYCYRFPGIYVAEVTIFNNVSVFSTQLSITVKKLECHNPKVVLIQRQTRILKSRPSYFEASVDLQRCTAYKAVYLWEAFRAPDCLEKDREPLGNIELTSPLLVLPKLTLDVGRYCLQFTVTLQGSPLQWSESFEITVVQSQLVALIKGGSQRVWSAHRDLLLDGSESHDPDIGTGEDHDLQYHWNYSVQNGSVSALVPPILSNTSTMDVSGSTLQPNMVYVFSLTVYKAGKPATSTSQIITVKGGKILPVNIECYSCSALSTHSVSHSLHVTLSGKCEACSSTVLYEWKAIGSNGELLELNEVTTTTGDTSPDLVVRKGVLQDGVHYTFTLSITHPASHSWGSASVTLVPNYPPSGGACTLNPNRTIYLLETIVTYQCSGWIDEERDLTQLIYMMQVEMCQRGCQSCNLFTLYRGTKSNFGTLVPLGTIRAGDLPTVNVLIQVEDSLGAKVIALNRTLTVLLPSLPAEGQGVIQWLKNKSQSELWSVVQQANPQEVIPYSLALTSMLNQIPDVNEQELEARIAVRSNITNLLTSLNINSMDDVAQISSALAQCVAVPREFACAECQQKVLDTSRRMIALIKDKTGLGDDTPLSIGTDILQILGGSMAAVDHNSTWLSIGSPVVTASVFSLVGDLMRSLMRSRVPSEAALKLTASAIQVMGHRVSSTNLLCTKPSPRCQFYIPNGLSSRLREEKEVVQILMEMEINPYSASPPISTSLAAMEFTTPEGLPIPISDLPDKDAIRVMLRNHKRQEIRTKAITIPPQGSVNFTVKTTESDPKAGLFLYFNFTLPAGRNGWVRIFVDDRPAPSHLQHLLVKELCLSCSSDRSFVEENIFLSPLRNASQEYYVNVSSLVEEGPVQAHVCVFSSLCQYFSPEERAWSSKGLSPLSGSTPETAHCLTQHLTVFGASLFVHHSALILLPPSEGPVQNQVVVIVSVILLIIYLATVLIAHKLDDIDINRVGIVPLCGQSGRYHYRVLLKTGWNRGSGTTAHVGISLYGLNKSGSRHLDREGAFQRNSLDTFQIETDANLGEIWKIRIWHDNTGLDPSWFLQYVVVWDKQTDSMYRFLVEDWLSVENERNEGMVEKEVLAACPQELHQFPRIFSSQLARGILDRHIWVSVWDRPPRSRFTRAQRVTCCALLLHLYLAAGAVWYGAVGNSSTGGPVSARLLVNCETIAVGMTVAVLVFPIHLLFSFLFRMTRSKATVEDPEPTLTVPQTVEMDVYLEHSDLGSSSFLSLPGGLDSILDGVSESSVSLGSKKLESALGKPTKLEYDSFVNRWPSCDSIFDIPDLLSLEPSLNRSRILKRKKAMLQLSIESPSSSPAAPPAFSLRDPDNQLTLSEEDLIKSIAADNTAGSSSSDSGRYSPRPETDLSDLLESSCSGWSDLSDERKPYQDQLRKTGSSISGFTSASSFMPSPSPASLGTLFSTRIGMSRRPPDWLFPPWVQSVTYLLAVLVLCGCLVVVVLYGTSFHNSLVLMWLISAFSAFLTSVLLLEPAKVLVQALFLALVVKPVDPDEHDTLVEEPLVKKATERMGKVRPPCGYGLLHAKEEARKVRALRSLMKNCIIHMVFLLVVLVVNYQDRIHAYHGRMLHSAVRHSLVSNPREGLNFSTLKGATEAWKWIHLVLVPHLYHNPSLGLVGVAQLTRLLSPGDNKDAIQISWDNSPSPTVHGASWDPYKWVLGHPGRNTSTRHTPSKFPWQQYFGWLGVHGSEVEAVELGNSSQSSQSLLSDLFHASWIDAQTRAVSVEFTQYHRKTGLFLVVTALMEWPQSGFASTSLSIWPLCLPSSSSGLDLHIAMMVLLLGFGLCFLGSELQAILREGRLYVQQGWRCLQLLVAVLSLGITAVHSAFLSLSSSRLRHHRSQRHTFTSFHTVALLSQTSSQLSAVLLTILVIKTVRQLRFVRRWAAFGKTLQLAWQELCSAALLLLLLLLAFAQTGYLLFCSTGEEFRTFGQTCLSLVSVLLGKARLGQVSHRYPVCGQLYLLTFLGCLIWILARLFGAVLIHSYRAVQAEMYRPAMEPQDYEMVEFFIKRFKLWMGISKPKEFRHKVKFEGMESLPSRSSQDSKDSCGPAPPRLGSALSLGSEDSSVSESSQSNCHDVGVYLERLQPAINSLLSQFDRVNKVTEDLYHIELDLHTVQSRLSQKRKPPIASPHLSPSPPPLSSALSSWLRLPRTHTTFSESALTCLRPHHILTSDPGLVWPTETSRRPSLVESGPRRVPGRRAWNSGASLSTDVPQRTLQAGSTVRDRPKSEEGKQRLAGERAPVKRRAWHFEGL
ncbi:polycystin-1 [Amia ocellicauda]|uniref:polycystin-1 n=1 Tax=Amia ocellicauda TaxID=2972642 RepID=UPI003464E612